jgi:ribosome-associated translation inhibitor RaiA
MSRQVTFKNCDSSIVAQDRINAMLEKIDNFLRKEPTPIWMDIIIQPAKTKAHHEVEFLLKSPNYDLTIKKEGTHIYEVLENVIDLMYLRLREEKDRRIEDRKMVGRHEDFKKQR